MKNFFVSKGRRLHIQDRFILLNIGIVCFLPFLFILGLFHWYVTLPLLFSTIQNNIVYVFSAIVSVMLLVIGWRMAEKMMAYVEENETLLERYVKIYRLADYLHENGFYQTVKSANGKDRKTFPPIYLKIDKKEAVDTITFKLGNQFHEQFLNMGAQLESLYMADLIEKAPMRGLMSYKLLVDARTKRYRFEETFIKDGALHLMKGLKWEFETLPHMLITGGTGGGKTYFIYTLITLLGRVGRVHIADPKNSDLAYLSKFPIFDGLVVVEKDDIIKQMQRAVDLMDARYAYMNAHMNQKMGVNYRYYELTPEFFIIDEWAAFVSTLSHKETEKLYASIKPLVLKARQAGVFLILATQKAMTDVLPSTIRDNLMCKVSLGILSETGYATTFGSDDKGKHFVNLAKVRGRGYIDVGDGIVREFYAPFIEPGFSFERHFKAMAQMPTSEVPMIATQNDEADKKALLREKFASREHTSPI